MKQNTLPIVLLLVFLFLPHNSWGQPSTSKVLKAMTIQVASLKNAAAAEKELKRLISRDLDAFIQYEQVRDKGMFYRICVGRFDHRDDAIKFAQRLKDQGMISGFLGQTDQDACRFGNILTNGCEHNRENRNNRRH